jgi:hypothetical protein
MTRASRRFQLRGWKAIAGLVLAASFALAVVVPTVNATHDLAGAFDGTVSWNPRTTGAVAHPAAEVERTLAPLRGLLPTGARVGYVSPLGAQELMATEASVQRFFAAQYALAPTVLTPIYGPECVARGAWPCGMGRAQFLLVPDAAVGVVALASDLRFLPVARAGGLTLFARSSP